MRSYVETLMTYGSEAAAMYLWNAYWYLDTGDVYPVEPSAENVPATANRVSSFVGTGLVRVGESKYLADYIVTYVTCPYTRC